MRNTNCDPAVAIYWDFENLHASVYEKIHGPGTYSLSRNQPQEALIAINAIMDCARNLGCVIINRAYANWQWLSRYQRDLNENAFDLRQHFPKGLKNGEDIHLALDVVEDLQHYPNIGAVLLVSSDSDFINLALKVRQSGRAIIGLGMQDTANRFWMRTCDDFLFYEDLLRKSGLQLPRVPANGAFMAPREERNPRQQPELPAASASKATHSTPASASTTIAPPTAPVSIVPTAPAQPLETPAQPCAVLSKEDARLLMLEVMRDLAPKYGEGKVPRSVLKSKMRERDRRFDESAYGCEKFSDFVSNFPRLFENIAAPSGGGFVRLLDDAPANVSTPHAAVQNTTSDQAAPPKRPEATTDTPSIDAWINDLIRTYVDEQEPKTLSDIMADSLIH